jgi:single-strand DNA-binding protein
MNVFHGIGNLGKDPEIRYTQSGMAVCNFSIAISEKFGEKETTEWLDIVVWQKVAENCVKFLKKGDKVAVSGRLQTREWQDKQDIKRYKTEIVANSVEFLVTKNKTNKTENVSQSAKEPAPMSSGAVKTEDVSQLSSGAVDSDDVPF